MSIVQVVFEVCHKAKAKNIILQIFAQAPNVDYRMLWVANFNGFAINFNFKSHGSPNLICYIFGLLHLWNSIDFDRKFNGLKYTYINYYYYRMLISIYFRINSLDMPLDAIKSTRNQFIHSSAEHSAITKYEWTMSNFNFEWRYLGYVNIKPCSLWGKIMNFSI